MKVSYNWLAQYVDLNGIDAYELADRLTNSGVAVDIVEKLNDEISNVVIGYVENSEKHPNAEKLNLCTVNVGEKESLQIICGASNVAKGQKVPVALVGSKLPGGLKIKKTKLRGISSEGMICSAKELGLNEKLLPKEKTEGILVLPNDLSLGDSIDTFLGLNDYVLELDLTPNRADCLSMIGVAYEVAAILARDVKLPKNILYNNVNTDDLVTVRIEAEEACPHYAARLLTDVKIEESPQWLQNKLVAANIRPINNVVDITNYVLLEYGQPLHAFDYDKLNNSNILVRMANPNEKIITLDNKERELDEEMLLITDGDKPIAIAGVMGGANSEVSDTTTSILLESAFFSGDSIRKTSRKLALRSEASLRYEKGVDPNRIYSALNRAAELLQKIAGANIKGDIYEHKIKSPVKEKIHLNSTRINKLLGTNIEEEEMILIFERLKFKVDKTNEGVFIEIPTRRQDITIEADLAEEVARIYGYDNIPTTLPNGVYIQGGLNKKQNLRRKIKSYLNAVGLKEVITYSFTNSKQEAIIKGLSEISIPIELAMPLSEERSILRTKLLPNILEVARYNVNRKNADIRIFEMGATFISDQKNLKNLPIEKQVVAGLITGQLPQNWQNGNEKIDFYYAKGIIEGLFNQLGIDNVDYQLEAITGYHPGRTAKLISDNQLLGYLGQLHPNVQKEYDLKETYVFELDLDKILAIANNDITYRELPIYPAIQRDISLVIDKNLEAKQLIDVINKEGKNILEDITIFDVYESEQLEENKKSIAISLIFRSLERTLTDDEVTKIYEKIINKLKEQYDAELRK